LERGYSGNKTGDRRSGEETQETQSQRVVIVVTNTVRCSQSILIVIVDS
jgi:hypothetical protein